MSSSPHKIVTGTYVGFGVKLGSGWLGEKLLYSVTEYNDCTIVSYNFSSSGVCSIQVKCPNTGRLIAAGKAYVLSTEDEGSLGIPHADRYSFISGSTYDREGMKIGSIENGHGTVTMVECSGEAFSVTFESGRILRRVPIRAELPR